MLHRSPVLLGMTRGEWTLVLFIFGLVYSAGLLVRFGEWFGERAFGKGGPSSDDAPPGSRGGARADRGSSGSGANH